MIRDIRTRLLAGLAAVAVFITYYPQRLPAAAEPDFDIIYIPDIQKEAKSTNANGAAYAKTVTWIKNFVQTSGENVLMVVGLGDTIDTPCSGAYSSSQDATAAAAFGILDSAGIKWILATGNHDYLSAGSTRNVSTGWRDSGGNNGCSGYPTPGVFSGQQYVQTRLALWPTQAGGYGYQYSGINSGDNGISIVRVNNAGRWHAFATADFFPTTTELNTLTAWIDAHPTDTVHVATHALGAGADCTQADWSGHNMQYWPASGCNAGTGVNSAYGLTTANSSSGQAILAWAQTFSNIVTLASGHYYSNALSNGAWSYRTDSANDGHQIAGFQFNWQNLEDNGPFNSAGTTVAWTAGGGTCPAAGSTGCTAEVGFVVIARFSPSNGTQKYYALATNTGDYVASGSPVPAPGNSASTPLVSLSYSSFPLSGTTVSTGSVLNGVARH